MLTTNVPRLIYAGSSRGGGPSLKTFWDASVSSSLWQPLVKDMIIRHLQSISVEQLKDLRYRQILKNDLMIRLNSLFPNEPPWDDLDPVKRILFTEFYKQ